MAQDGDGDNLMPQMATPAIECPRCRESGLQSFLVILKTTSTLKPHHVYFDADGTYHCHNPNIMNTTAHCRSTHQYKLSFREGCGVIGCDYEPRVTRLKQDSEKR